jgi:hypothetical protein
VLVYSSPIDVDAWEPVGFASENLHSPESPASLRRRRVCFYAADRLSRYPSSDRLNSAQSNTEDMSSTRLRPAALAR